MPREEMNTQNGQEQEGGKSPWFEGRRDHFLCQVVMDFFSFSQSFIRLYEEYLACGRLEAGRLRMDLLATRTGENRQRIWEQLAHMIGSETGKGELWQLKDLCHQIWPGQDQSGSVHGALLDWLVGSVFHEAMMQEASEEYPENTVISEFQKGYMIHDRLLRPALVAVSKGKPKPGENDS